MKFVNKKIFFFLFFSLFFVTGFFVFSNLVNAQITTNDLGLQQVAATGLPNTDIRIIIARIIKSALGLLGVIAVGLVLYAGYLWMTAGGDDEKIGTSKKILLNAAIGLVIILSAYSIVSFVMSKLVEATTGNVSSNDLCEQQKANGGSVYGGACPLQQGCLYGSCAGGQFVINSMPAAGAVCIRNVAPVIVFNLDIDVDTLKNNIVVENASTSVPVTGVWSWQSAHHHAAYFNPTNGTCPAPDTGKDCFDASTTYKLKIKNNGAGIKSANGKDLNCALSKGGCADVIFTTGDGVDRQNPVISIINSNLNNIKQGDDVSVSIHFEDDGGLQNLMLNADDILVDSKNFNGCQKSGNATIVWPTASLSVGNHKLKAIGLDWAANTGEGDLITSLKPAHCFDSVLNLGEKFIDCGGECQVCSGDKCANDTDCVSGYCSKTGGASEGVCVDKTFISAFSPVSAAVGDYVSIVGKNFGNSNGHVYFAKVQNPSVTKATDWVEAQVVNCGVGFNNWTDNQIIVSVPDSAISGKIAVYNANATGADANNIKYFDTTGDGFKKIPNFVLGTVTHPGICGLTPAGGAVGTNFNIVGKNFGLQNPAISSVNFADNTKAKIMGWTDSLILSVAPISLGNGDYGVKVISANNQTSNSVIYSISGSNQDIPLISDISAPSSTTIGDYITITGKNFGDKQGVIWFKNGASETDGSFNFPADCKNSVWKDNQVIVKVPNGLTAGNVYTIQVYNSVSGLNSALDNNKNVKIYTGSPSPGICQISPVSGKLPFVAPNILTASGEYLTGVNKFYFWKAGGAINNITNTLVGVDAVPSADGKSLTTFPGSAVSGVANIISGSVFAYRNSDQKQSNGLLFSVNDCVKNGCASSNDKCCMSGNEVGMCKPTGKLCSGEFKSSGFVWAFSTKEIVPPPQVVERCDSLTDSGKGLPSPSPSTQWNDIGYSDAGKVCQTALVTVEFNAALNQSTINSNSVLVNSCDSIDVKGVCVNPIPVVLSGNSLNLNVANVGATQETHPFLSIKTVTGKWDENKLYQVMLKNSIKSVADAKGASTTLMATRPCGNGTAYCFSFKTGKGDCVLKEVVITPNNFWAKYLESPMKYHTIGGDISDVYYRGNGLSSQHCTMMDVAGYDWTWSVNNKIVGKTYAEINGANNKIVAQVNTKANTVGVGVPGDSVVVVAAASTSSASTKTGSSTLTIDLSNPEVVEFWPNCLEACTNASVGARFNITMSSHNSGPNSLAVKLQQCNDENCLSLGASIATSSFDVNSGNTVLKIANDGAGAALLPNTLYQVTLSATGTPGVDIGNQLWSVSDSSNLSSFAKPYNKSFTWRFRTKKEACKVDRVSVLPKVFVASKILDRTVFQAQSYASPDACSVTGQKLNAWNQDWSWSSSNIGLATVVPTKTKGSSAFCTAECVLKGSTVPSGQGSLAYPICGNGKIEAGEDCDAPDFATGCSLNCKFLGNLDSTTSTNANVGKCGDGFVSPNKGEACDVNDSKTKFGCNDICLHVGSKIQTNAKDINASICGNGMVGSGEDCDLGVVSDQKISSSSMNCSAQCLHLGTRLSSKWCFDNKVNFGGFAKKDFNFYCGQSYSQCGDGVKSPDEDLDCEFTDGVATGKHKDYCNDRCLYIDKTHSDIGCEKTADGCGDNGQHLGSSLSYPVPSVCGDGNAGAGEDSICETDDYLTNLWHKNVSGSYFNDPWVLVIGQAGVAGQVVSTSVTVQESNITGSLVAPKGVVSGSGVYQVKCGYKSDAECQAAYSGDPNSSKIGVGNNSCCYFKSKLTGVYPGNTTTVANNICINTFIGADFDSVIDQDTLPGNFVIARSATAACSGGLQDVSTSTSFLASFDSSLPWYKNIFNKIIVTFKNIFGMEVNANTWCAGADIGSVDVIKNDNGGSKILFNLNKPLAPSTDYVVILKNGIKNIQGVSIESDSKGKAVGWRFKTGQKICEITGVTVDPNQYYFSVPNANTDLVAKGLTANKQEIQPVAGYSWNYVWGPVNNPYVLVGNSTSSVNTITSQNNNGEVDVHAAANIIENSLNPAQTGLVATGKSHVIVYLCEHPWPPKKVIAPGQTTASIIFPYEDKAGNNDGFDLTNNIFNNTSIPAASVGNGYFNFSTYYCADNGEHGYADDLPYLRPTVQYGDSINIINNNYGTSTEIFKRFIFTNDVNGDAIGVQVLSNPNHLSPHDWYTAGKELGGQGFGGNVQDTKIDGYDAVTDGNNVYVSALNLNPAAAVGHGSLFTNIYLFSVNPDAKPETRKVFESLLKNLKFNINLTNYGYCGADINNPGDSVACSSDFDCPIVGSCKAIITPTGFCGAVPAKQCTPANVATDCPQVIVNGYCQSGKCENNPAVACDSSIDYPPECELPTNDQCVLKDVTSFKCSNDLTKNCTTDANCQIPQVCSVQKDKLKRNFSRLQDLGSIEKSLKTYKSSHNNTYPDLTSGTYLSGQTISTWPSWSLLSNAVGKNIPADPVNKLGVAGTCSSSTGQFCVSDANCGTQAVPQTCILHDPVTGWSTADKRFSFACANDSLAYRYISTSTNPASSNYVIKFKMEEIGIIVDNSNSIINDFIEDTSHFVGLNGVANNYGICSQSNEITTINQGTCGDGKVNLNKGEICDPPGGIVWNQSTCGGAANANSDMTGQMCSTDCKNTIATTTKCGILAKCGNGKVEVGETCDEGGLNGKYNHCNLNCNGMSSSCGDGKLDSAYEVCDTNFDYYLGLHKDGSYPGFINYTGWCSGGLLAASPCSTDDDCKTQPYSWGTLKSNTEFGTVGKCIPVSFNNNRYGLEKNNSCNFDCQKNGPYCGDGIVQSEFGEECDGSESCKIGSLNGNRVCDWNCRWNYKSSTTSPIAYYDFDDVVTLRNGWKPLGSTIIGDFSYILNKGNYKSGNSTFGAIKCQGTGAIGCPTTVSSYSTSFGQGMNFNGSTNYFTADNGGQFNVNELTFATWINVDPNTTNGWHAVISKQNGAAASVGERDFNFYVVTNGNPAIVNNLHFFSANATGIILGVNNATDGTKTLFNSGEWHFVALTVDAARNFNYYLDGNLLSKVPANGNPALKADRNYPLWIGRADNWFKGSMDEMHMFGRALSAEEINDLYKNGKNFCEAKIESVVDVAKVETGCGNGKIDANEACDKGSQNGIACIPSYNKSCTYCAVDCKGTKVVEATQYCGDGIINGGEKCDTVNTAGVDFGKIFSLTTTTGSGIWKIGTYASVDTYRGGYQVNTCGEEFNTQLNSDATVSYQNNNVANLITKIGTKSCVNNCSGISNNCVECGLKKGGSVVSGAVINVLSPESANPLKATFGIDAANVLGGLSLVYPQNGSDVNFATDKVASQYYSEGALFTNFLLTLDGTLSGDQAEINSDPVCSDKSQLRSYKIAVNDDINKDHLIDFPVYGTTTPDIYNLFLSPIINQNIRPNDLRVVVSWVGNEDFISGFNIPSGVDNTLEGLSPTISKADGFNYYNLLSPFKGVYYHGFRNVNNSNVESFTVQTAQVSTGAYAFYVRTPSVPIKNLKNSTKLKVEVYMPENDVVERHFDRPIKTYYLSQALPSDNSVAQYWHVFNIKSVPANTIATLDNSIMDINMIRSVIKMSP